MQIRTIFHNANFLKKSTPNADERAALKAGRRLVCVLLMLVACAGAAWGDVYYRTDPTKTGPLEWTTSGNWQISSDGSSWTPTTSVPDISGTQKTYIYLYSDVNCASPDSDYNNEYLLAFCSGGTNEISIYLNGHTLKLTRGSFFIGAVNTSGSTNDHPDAYPGTVSVYGSGQVITPGLDTTNFATCTLNLKEGVTFTVETTYYGNLDGSNKFNIKSDGTCTLYIPASGANVNYGTNQIDYYLNDAKINTSDGSSNIPFLRPYGTPSVYKIETDGGDPTTDPGMKITFTRAVGHDRAIAFAFAIVSTKGTWQWKKDGDENYSDISGSVEIQNDNVSYYLKNQNHSTGDSIVISFKTPDGTMELAEIRCGSSNSEVVWKGTSGDSWTVDGNWSSGSVPGSDANVIIPAGCLSYPKLTDDLEAGSITIKNNARVEQTGGTLTVNKLVTEGTGKFTSTAGTVSFKGTDATWQAVYAEFSSFTNVKTADSTTKFDPASDLYIKGNFSNAGGQFDGTGIAVYFQNGNHLVTGNSTASYTHFGQVLCTNHGDKTITFENKITVDTLSLSGDGTAKLTVAGSTNSEITLASDQSATFLSIQSTAPAVSGAAINCYSSEGDSVTGWTLVTDESTYVWKGTSSTWGSNDNWLRPGTDETKYPTVSENKITAGSIVIPSTASVSPETPPASAFVVSNSFEISHQTDWSSVDLTISGDGTVKFGDGSTPCVIKLKSLEVSNAGTFTVSENCTLIITGNFERKTGDSTVSGIIKSTGGTITLEGTTTVSANADFQASNVTLTAVNVPGAWIANSCTITTLNITGNALFTQRTGTTITTLNVGANDMHSAVLTAGSSISAGTINNYGTISLEGYNLTYTTYSGVGTVKAAGSVSVAGSGSIGSFTVTGDATISGTFSVGIFTVENGNTTIASGTTVTASTFKAQGLAGKTFSVNGTIKATTLQLSGTSTTSRLTVTGSGEIRLATSQSGGRYLTIPNNSGPQIKNETGETVTEYYTAVISDATNGIPSGWKIISDATSVIWTGLAGTSDWNTPANWSGSTVPGINADVQIVSASVYPKLPSGFDNNTIYITINSDAELETSGSITCSSFTNNGTLKVSGDEVTITNASWGLNSTIEYCTDGSSDVSISEIKVGGSPVDYSSLKLKVDEHVTFVKTSGNLTATGITNNGTIKVSGNVQTDSYSGSGIIEVTGASSQISFGNIISYKVRGAGENTSLSVAGNASISALSVVSGKKVTVGSTMTVGSVINEGTLALSGNPLTVSGILTNDGKVTSSGTNLTAATYAHSDGVTTDRMELSGDVTLSLGAGTITNLSHSGGGTLTSAGTGGIQAGTLTINGSAGVTTTLSGNMTLGKLVATGLGGQTLTINGTITVGNGTTGNAATQTLQLSGTSASSKLTVGGSGTIKLNASQVGGDYLNVLSSAPVVKDLSDTATVSFVTAHSTGPDPAPTGWTIFAGDPAYVWRGTSNNDWGTAGNWDVNAVPPENSAVIIETTSGKPDPVTSSALTLASLTVKSGKGITLGGNLTVTGELKNEGTVDTNGKALSFASYSDPSTGNTGTIKVGASGTITTGNSATVNKVVFSGTRTDYSGFTDITIKNIELADSASLTTSGSLTLSGNVTVGNSALLTTGTDCYLTLSTGDFINNGTVTLGDTLQIGGALTNNGTIHVGEKTVRFASYSGSSDTITIQGGTIVAQGAGGTIGTLTMNGNAGLNNNGTGSLTVTACTVNADATLATAQSASSSMPRFAAVTVAAATPAVTLTLGSNLTVTGLLTNNGTVAVGSHTLSFGSYTGATGNADTVTVSGGTITAGSSWTAGNVTVTSGTLTLSNDLTVTGLLTNNGTVAVGSHTLSFGSYTGATGNTDTVTVSGGTINAGSSSACTIGIVSVENGTLTLGNDLTVAGLLTNNGTVSVGNHALKFITYTGASGTVTVAGGSITSTGGGTINGGAINQVSLNGNASISKTGMGAFRISTVSVEDDAVLTQSFSESATSLPEIEKIAVGGHSLTAGTDGIQAGTLTINGSAGATMTLSGNMTLGKLVATGLGGQTLNINGELTIGETLPAGTTATQTLQLSGTSASSKLTVGGSGTIKLNASQVGGSYLNVSGPAISKINSTDDDVIYTTTYSSGTSVSGWNICDGELVYVWTGNAGTTSWTTGKNWSVYLAPVNTDDNVKIATAPYYPETSQNLSLKNLTVETGASVTVVNNTLGFKTYSGSGTVILKSDGNLNVISGGSGGTVENLKYAESHGYTAINSLAVKNVTVDPGVELTLNSNLSLASGGVLTNYGIIDIGSNSLSCASYYTPPASTEGIGTIKPGLGTFNPGSGGTLNKIEFTATRNFENISNLTVTNGTVDSGVALTITSGGLSFAGSLTNTGTISLQSGDLTVGGALDNNGTVNIGSRALQFAQYQHTANTLTDALTIAGGSITAAAGGNGTGMISVSSLTMNGNATVTNNGSGALKFASATVNANVLLTSGGSGSAPVFSALKITGGNTLTLASNISAGNVTIEDGATLDADSRGVTPSADSADPSNPVYGCTTFGGGYVLTVSGNFINENTGHSNATPYPGFVAQHGRVEITGNGTHEIRGNNKFHDFVCVSPGATLVFDANKTTNVDHQIWLEGSGSNLITLTTDNAAEGDKWTLDVVWDVAAGTAEHRKPHIEYAAPHKSISYSAKLKGCLVGCIDDAPNLRDSTNVNWFDDMPSIFMSLASVGGKQLAVMFSTEVDAVAGRDLRTAVALKTDTGSNLIDASVPVSMYSGSTDKSKTVVVYGLTRALTWDDLFGSASDRLHVEIVQSGAVLVRNSNIKYQMGVKHCASDFAINGVRMLFGYDNYIDPSTTLTAEKGTNSVRTWDQSDPISNRLHSDSDLLFQAQFDESAPSGLKLEMAAMNASQLNASVIGNNLMDYYGLTTRLWLPSFYQPVSTVAQSVPSGQVISQDSSSSGRLRNFTLHYSASSTYPLFQMKDGEEIQFMFKVKNADDSDFQIIHDYAYDAAGQYVPVTDSLYAIRLVDDADITTFDLWSVMLQATTLQRGNVTILNNVINSDQKEQTFVTIQMQKAGSLTVQVLTLDGAVVTTLQRGRKQAGTYGYSWNGTNGKGKPVARGMYFVRVIGPDIDETRKVMVVRD